MHVLEPKPLTPTEQIHGNVGPHRGQTHDLINSLVDELVRRWQANDEVPAEEFLHRHPELWRQPEQALELVYEEICQRSERGQKDAAAQVMSRFPQWRDQLEVMVECHRLLEPSLARPTFPEAGATLAGFHLIKPLGHGASGRVFLASQPALADRPVVVKLTSLHGQEHLNLARLQHTHIVPLYAVHDDPARNLRILCMPYFGGVTLDELLRAVMAIPVLERTGARLLDVLNDSGIEATGPARNILRQLSFEKAMCWIGLCLAEALHYAHECGLVHFDLKPSNVLMAADGQPMLLDFHLARPPISVGGPIPGSVGGTPGYMPPEQESALRAISTGKPIDAPVDGRADIYALGAILYQAFGGQLPHKSGVSPSMSRFDPQVSIGLSDILDKCLQPNPSDRYTDAAALATDLRCHLHDLPLQEVSNRSLTERYRKWRRRRPTALRTLILLGVVICTVAVMVWGVLSHWSHLLGDAEFALDEGRKNWRERQRFDEARETLRNGLVHARAVPFQDGLIHQFEEELLKVEHAHSLAKRKEVLARLHTLADQVRALAGIESLPISRLAALDRSCREFWAKRQAIKTWLEPSRTEEAGKDLVDLALFAAELQVRLAAKEDHANAVKKSLHDLEELESLFGPSVILDLERDRYRQILGLAPIRRADSQRRATTAWEHCALGRAYLKGGDLDKASHHLQAALVMQPHGFWPNFYQGLCASRRGNAAESVASFSVCIGSSPEVAGTYFNRALGYTALGLPDLALRDYDQALRLDSTLTPAAVNREFLMGKRR